MQKVVVCFSPAVRESKQLWTMSRGALPPCHGRSARHQQTGNHASKQAAHQQNFHEALKQCILCVHRWHAGALKSASVRALGRLAFEPGRCCGLVQVACSIYQGYTSRFPEYISKATMLLVSESGASRKKRTKGGKTSFWTFNLGVKGIILPMPKNIFLQCIEFRKVQVLNELFHRVTPVRSTLKSVDDLGAVDTRKRQDFWGQILTLHTVSYSLARHARN
jgi:hypothetical protein